MKEEKTNTEDEFTPQAAPIAVDPLDLAKETIRATETLSAISANISQLTKVQELNCSQQDELRKQISYLKEVIEYLLNTNPETIENTSQLYPIAQWLQKQFETLGHSIPTTAKPAIEQQTQATQNEQHASTRLAGIESLLHDVLSQLKHREQQLSSIQALQDRQLELASTHQIQLEKRSSLSPYDDFDLQIQGLKKYIEEKAGSWKIQQNFFYVLVLILLILNLCMLCWFRFIS